MKQQTKHVKLFEDFQPEIINEGISSTISNIVYKIHKILYSLVDPSKEEMLDMLAEVLAEVENGRNVESFNNDIVQSFYQQRIDNIISELRRLEEYIRTDRIVSANDFMDSMRYIALTNNR